MTDAWLSSGGVRIGHSREADDDRHGGILHEVLLASSGVGDPS